MNWGRRPQKRQTVEVIVAEKPLLSVVTSDAVWAKWQHFISRTERQHKRARKLEATQHWKRL